MNKLTALILIAFLPLVLCAGDDRTKVSMNHSGAIVFGDKQLALRNDSALWYTVGSREIFSCVIYTGNYKGGKNYWQVNKQSVINTKLDPATKTITIDGQVGGKNNKIYPPTARYQVSMQLDKDGLIKYNAKLIGISKKDFQMCGIMFIFPKDTLSEAKIKADKKTVTIPKSLQKGKNFNGNSVELFSNNDDLALTINAVMGGSLQGRDARKYKDNSRYNIFCAFNDKSEAAMTFRINRISKEKLVALQNEVSNKFDPNQFEKYNLAELPNFKISRNLIQNPSFEEGIKGWSLAGLGCAPVNQDHARESIIIDASTAWNGKNSLRFQLRPGGYPGMLAPYTSQLIPGKIYTMSFYGKTDMPGLSLQMASCGKTWGKFPHQKTWKLTNKWQRYSTTFVAKESVVSFCFGYGWGNETTATKGGPDKIHAWLDGVQLEEAGKATDFSMKPIAISMVKTPAYFPVNSKKKFNFNLINTTKEARTINAKFIVRDFNKREIEIRKFKNLLIPANASIPIELPLGKAVDYIGFYSIKIEISDSQGYRDYDFRTFAVMNPYSKEQNRAMKNRLIFSLGSAATSDPNLKLMREIGVGGIEPGDMFPISKEDYQRYEKEGFLLYTGIFGDNFVTRRCKRWPIFKKVLDIKDINGPYAKELLAFLPGYFREHKHIKYWKYFNEPDFHKASIPGHIMNPKVHADFMAKVYAILKKEIPDAKVLSSDPWECGEGARKWLSEMMKAGGVKYIDILADHSYRSKPEKPDLSHDIFELIKVADDCGFKGPIWFTEGGHMPTYAMPSLGVFPDKMLSADNIRIAPFTADTIGNRSGFAYYVRFLLMALRHTDRIKMYTNWTSGHLLDSISSKPLPVGTMYNATARLLGESNFVKEYKYGDTLKAYLFDDGKGNGIVTIWDFDDKIERNERAPLVFRFNARKDSKITDLFGRPLPTRNSGNDKKFDIDYMPQIISGGTVKELDAAMQKSAVLVDEEDAVGIKITIADKNSLKMTIRNRDSRDFKGKVDYTLNGQPGTHQINLKGLSGESFLIPISNIVDQKTARYKIKLAATIYNATGKKVKELNSKYSILTCNPKSTPITIDGDLADWNGYRFGKVGGKEDLIEYRSGRMDPNISAQVAYAWDADNLYLAVEVDDPKYFQGKNTLFNSYKGDSLQLFIDAYKDGTKYSPNSGDDYAYLIFKTPEGKDTVFRNWTPERQICFLKNNVVEKDVEVKIKRNEAEKKTIYELRFPKKTLMPVVFRKNAVIGLAIMINDAKDGDRDAALTTANGKEGYKQSHNLSFFLFE